MSKQTSFAKSTWFPPVQKFLILSQ